MASAVVALGACWVLWSWFRGVTITELVRQPPHEVDLPQFVTILGYLHHELIKHRLPLVRMVAERELDEVQPGDVDLLKQVLTGRAERPSVVAELDGYLSGLRRAAGSIHLNFWRDPLVRRTRHACQMIQQVADGLGTRVTLTRSEHAQLRKADRLLDGWFRPRLQALRNSVLILEVTQELLEEPISRVQRELGLDQVEAQFPELEQGLKVRMLHHDFDLVLRNLTRNALKASAQHGTPKIAIEITTRLELTGEESVLVRIHDTDPTILSRDMLYGGSIGRGLNLVTTTLRRYNASLRCVKSRREGFAKYLEVRLFREFANEAEGALLDERDPAGFLVPAAAMMSLVVALVGLGASAGRMPDPFKPVAPVVANSDVGASTSTATTPSRSDLQSSSSALLRARGEAVSAFEEARQKAVVTVRNSITIPGPRDIQADRRRCEPVLGTNKLELSCRLVNLDYRLEPPLLLLSDITGRHDLTRFDIALEELTVEVDTKHRTVAERKVAPKERCARLKT
ncbi:MAG: ATP-binding protein, partial [Myxococcota bacterium]